MKNRLIELIEEAAQIWDESPLGSFNEVCADHLLANGVIVPPMKEVKAGENWSDKLKKGRRLHWIETAAKLLNDTQGRMLLVPLDKGKCREVDSEHGAITLHIPLDIAEDLMNGSNKYVGGLLLIDRATYEQMKGGDGE